MNAIVKESPAESLVGSFRTFGDCGPTYEVTAVVGENKVRIEVVESGEGLDYAIGDALRDPIVA